MAKQYWLVKQEPSAFSWDDFVRDGVAVWDGVRNYQARNNLRLMKCGDRVLFYHSVTGKEVVGIAEVTKEHQPEKTKDKGDWSVVEFKPLKPLKRPVPLDDIKADAELAEMALVKQSRLSVMPVTGAQFRQVLKLSGTKL